MKIDVAIIEDHKFFRESVAQLLNSAEEFQTVGTFGSVEEALSKLESVQVILLDINLPGLSGIEGIPFLKKNFPECLIIMLTVYDDSKNIFDAILNGADGYILKRTQPIRLLQSIMDAVDGGCPMTPIIAKEALNLFKNYVPRKSENIENLSNRELEVLKMLVDGLSNDEIAEKLFLSIQTVRNHIRHIYYKLHVHSKSQAVVKALKKGIV